MALLTGCATEKPEMHSQFDAEQVKPYLGTGPNTLTGQAFLRQDGGGIVTCAGRGVLLLPDTPYFREVIDLFAHGKIAAEPNMTAFSKQGQCDAQGNFKFDKVPNGMWLVLAEVTWEVGSKGQGGLLLRPVTLPGAPKEVILTGNDLIK